MEKKVQSDKFKTKHIKKKKRMSELAQPGRTTIWRKCDLSSPENTSKSTCKSARVFYLLCTYFVRKQQCFILRLSVPNPSEIYVLAEGLFHNVHMKL